MSQIPGITTSIAQSQLTQKQRAAETDASREAEARSAAEAKRKEADTRESVEDMVETTGLKVDSDGKHESEKKKKRRFLDLIDPENTADDPDPADQGTEARSHAAALLADPDTPDGPTPPPLMIDIEA